MDVKKGDRHTLLTKWDIDTGLFAFKYANHCKCYTQLFGPLFPSLLSPSVPLLLVLGIQPNFIRKSSTMHRTWTEWKVVMLSLPFNLGWIMRGSQCCPGSPGSEGDIG